MFTGKILIDIYRTRCTLGDVDVVIYDVKEDFCYHKLKDTPAQYFGKDKYTNPDVFIDIDKARFAYKKFIDVNKLCYDPRRGIRLECKNPWLVECKFTLSNIITNINISSR